MAVDCYSETVIPGLKHATSQKKAGSPIHSGRMFFQKPGSPSSKLRNSRHPKDSTLTKTKQQILSKRENPEKVGSPFPYSSKNIPKFL